MTETHAKPAPSLLRKITRWGLAWLAASGATGILATLMSTQFVIADLARIGAKVPLDKRLSMSVADLGGLGWLYTVFLALGFLIAFGVATGLYQALKSKLSQSLRSVVFIVAGLVSVAVTLYLMQQVFFGVELIAGARSAFGFIVQVLCGAIGGGVFAKLSGKLWTAG